jgi:dihydrofolate reductase
MARPVFSVFIACSLDGFIARPDDRLDFLDRFHGEEHGYEAFSAAIDTHLVGGATYRVVLGFPEWPYGEKPVVVWSRRGGTPRHGETFAAGSPLEVASLLEAAGARRVYVDGGATISAFLQADLVDDLTLSIIPVVLGDGIRLFRSPLPERWLSLVGSQSYPGGLVQLRYRRADR